MTCYIMGIDNGSQSSKVTIYAEDGRPCAEGRVPLSATDSPRPGTVEYPDDVLWDSIAEASRRAVAGFEGDLKEIKGIGLCTIRFCRVVLQANGSLAQPVMSWMDERVSRPYHRESNDAAYVTTSSGYITHRMTGNFKDTSANYQGMWPIDTDTWDWTGDESEYEATGIPRNMLFELVQPGEELGRLTEAAATAMNLPSGIPVIATANDKAVEALGAGLRDPSDLVISTGTYIASMAVGTDNVKKPESFWTNFASEPGLYLYESNGIRRGMWTVSWMRDLLGPEAAHTATARGESVEQMLGREAAAVSPGSDGLLTVLDWLAPVDEPYRKGSMLGFDARHGRGHMFRSILEGIAMTMKQRADEMSEELDRGFQRIVLTGGGSSSDLLTQIIADVFGLPTVRMTGASAASRGAAICAVVGTGLAKSFDAATKQLTITADEVLPNRDNAQTYHELGRVYRDIRAATDPLYDRTSNLFG
ncbi:sugar kinase [Kocuria koreensis]|uniref:Sugar kinase n=1 Tax=Rothia koreensis TaxID=592378 RepID=A0A7M3SW36_9MICC|nr:FGGY-family carbohydrate kinase [Rothia koreensis]MUN56001.1 sugar kinase [Rothia koreensis]